MLNIYSIPAIIALVAKGAILYYSRRAPVQNTTTRLFALAVLVSVGLSVVEASGLVYGFHSEYRDLFGFAYIAFAIPLLAAFVHLAILVVFSRPPAYSVLAVYAYAVLLESLALFTPLLFATFKPFKGYTVTAVGGPLYGLFEAFVVCSAAGMIFLPFFGLRKDRPAAVRSQCKLWIVAATPIAVLIAASVLLLHFKIHIFNVTVTSPLLITLLLVAVGYAVHSRRLIELDFYIPGSRTRREKKRFYEHLSRFYLELTGCASLQEVINRVSEILKCPVALISSANTAFIQTGFSPAAADFPRQALPDLEGMLVIDEIRATHPDVHAWMAAHQIGAIVPFYPRSKNMASWLLLGENFRRRIYTPLDFRVVERLFDKVGQLLLDQLVTKTDRAQTGDRQGEVQHQIRAKLDALLEKFSRQGQETLDKTLEEHLSEVEALLLKQAIEYCGGNRSKAARLLGMRPNTLHYKLERYGLLYDKRKI